MNREIRLAKKTDSEEILKIYAPYIRDTTISFETEIPTTKEFTSRVEKISSVYPYLVYLIDNKIVGYAYASKHAERAAYRFGVDLAVYILPEYHGMGVANALYCSLFELLKALGYINAYCCYTIPNEKSRYFHKKFGFKPAGIHHKTGYKFGKWLDVGWLEKSINEHSKNPSEIISIGELSETFIKDVLSQNIGDKKEMVTRDAKEELVCKCGRI